MPRTLPQSEKFGCGPDAYEYLLGLGPSLLWVPQVGNYNGIDLSDNVATPNAQNTGDLTPGTGPYPPRILGGAPACAFGGSSGRVVLPNLGALANYSLVIVAKKPSASGNGTMTVFGTEAGTPTYYLYWGYATKHRIRLYADSAERLYWQSSSSADDAYHLITVTDNGTTSRLYFDITQRDTGTSSGLPSNANGYSIAAGGMTNLWGGDVALVGVVGSVLTPAQITALYSLVFKGS